ncbi:hypothetical protein [Streptomyces sp. AHA2]|uniref:hypothetical protein n=1 Tax=Streptomyces sp. AHA2 TaxID=3064526 RepID=UPI002FE199FD
MYPLPDPQQSTAEKAGQAAGGSLTDAVIKAAVRDTIRQTSYRDETPIPQYGTTPPVPQPGRPPMSAKAVDDTARMLGASVLIATSGGATTAVLWASGYANPAVVALVFGAPTALALAIGRVMKRAKDTTPDVHHHHYAGPVDQRTVHSRTRGVWAKTTNQQ